MKTISLFDWNGELYQQVQDDQVQFGIKLTKIEGSECMGFTSFQIEGEEAAINTFLEYYELELDPNETFAQQEGV